MDQKLTHSSKEGGQSSAVLAVTMTVNTYMLLGTRHYHMTIYTGTYLFYCKADTVIKMFYVFPIFLFFFSYPIPIVRSNGFQNTLAVNLKALL